MCPSAPRVCSEPGGERPVLSLSLDLIAQHIDARGYGGHLAVDFRKKLCYDIDFTEVCSQGPNWQWVGTVPGNGLVPIKHQATLWIKGNLVNRRIYAKSCLSDVTKKLHLYGGIGWTVFCLYFTVSAAEKLITAKQFHSCDENIFTYQFHSCDKTYVYYRSDKWLSDYV